MNHKIPVVDLEGNQVGEEDMQFRSFNKDTANYVVHQAFLIWQYRNKAFTEFHPRRSDVKRGRKLWNQKGTGKARMGSTYSPLFGKSATNKNRHGLDDRRKKKIPRQTHTIAISTVLQSKWKGIKIVEGLEDIKEPRYYDLMDVIKNTTGVKPEKRSTLMIARNCYGAEHPIRCVPTEDSYRSPLYMAGRLIDKFEMRRPRDIDAEGDGLYQCLKARNLIISREAFFDLKAKFDAENGWSFMDTEAILVQQLQKLVKEYPFDRKAEFDSARRVHRRLAEREFWAKEEREKKAEEALQ
jgi:ribosomal protein L4